MPGVLLRNAVVKSWDGKIFVGLINVNKNDRRIHQLKPEFRPLTVKEERDSVTQFFFEFDIFMLPEDHLTFTPVKTFVIPFLLGPTPTNKPQYGIPHVHSDTGSSLISS